MCEKPYQSTKMSDFIKNIASTVSAFYRSYLAPVYPYYLLFLILYPSLIGAFINYKAIDIREIIINLVWLAVFTIPYFLSHKRIFYFAAVIVCFSNGFANLVHWLLVKGPITASSLFVFFSTNLQETVDFIELKRNFLLFLLVIPYLIVFIWTLRFPPLIEPLRNSKYTIIIAGLLSVVFIAENAFNNRLLRKGTPVLIVSGISFYKEIKAFREIDSASQTLRNVEVQAPNISANQTLIFIIGESVNRNHMSLYGYPRPTTPKLQSLPDIVVYDSVVSAYSNTISSILSSFSQANLENKMDYSKSIDIFDVYQNAGFKTYWISNQYPIGIWDNMVTAFAQKANTKRFINISGNSSFESTYKSPYDEELFPHLVKSLNEPNHKKLIMIHLMGSHSTYSRRYPREFSKFQDSRDERSEIVSEYDNSILYSDFVVDSMLKIIRHFSEEKKAACVTIYFSDHGENVYDGSNYAGHDFSENLSRHHVEIPFMIWLSPKYTEIFREKSEKIRLNIHKAFITDDLFHASLDLFDLKTPVFEKSRSVFNEYFNENRKRILVNGHDYDAIKSLN